MSLRALLVAAGLLLFANITGASDGTASTRAWTFDVYLDESRIGSHVFRLEEDDDGVRRLQAEARFDVKFLFINAFKYRHEIEETWSGDCLTDVEARTNSNGKRTEVVGELGEDGFTVVTDQAEAALGECVMTFAYWNPAFLDQPRLLNPQTGEFLAIEVEALGTQLLNSGGQNVLAEGYQVTARGLEVRVWYSPEAEWLALESSTKGGRIIRYELNT